MVGKRTFMVKPEVAISRILSQSLGAKQSMIAGFSRKPLVRTIRSLNGSIFSFVTHYLFPCRFVVGDEADKRTRERADLSLSRHHVIWFGLV